MKRTDISQGAKLCFGRLAQFAGKHDHAFPGHEALAKELGVHVRTVIEYLQELDDLGVIKSQRMGSGKFNVYFFISLKGVVEFKTDMKKTAHQSHPADVKKTTHADVQNPVIKPPSHYRLEENQ